MTVYDKLEVTFFRLAQSAFLRHNYPSTKVSLYRGLVYIIPKNLVVKTYSSCRCLSIHVVKVLKLPTRDSTGTGRGPVPLPTTMLTGKYAI